MIRVSVPATSANCCVGFDCLGLALRWMAEFTFEESDQLVITGCPKEYCNEENLVVQAFAHAARVYHKDMPAFALHIDSPIPFARGLGSSSCCVAAGILAANALLDLKLDKAQLLRLAVDLEGHPDNVAPAIYGSMMACFMEGDTIVSTQIPCADFTALAIIPPYPISTPMARKLLPAELPFGSAVAQVGHALVFESALVKGDQKLLFQSCQDVLHEPYRQKLIPEYTALKAMAAQKEIPFWISGSGSTLLMLAKEAADLEELAEQGRVLYPDFDFHVLSVCTDGAFVQSL